MTHPVVFSADLHGNETQYRKLVEFAIENSAKSVIIGGDIAPKGYSSNGSISLQRDFLSKKLPELLLPLKENIFKCNLYLIMGNDDCGCNIDVLQKHDSVLFHLIHNRRLKVTKDIDIVGYSYVPITPFGIKDWEKYDLSEPGKVLMNYILRKMINYRLSGQKSSGDGWQDFTFTPDVERKDSIQNDIQKETFTCNPERTVYVMHSPPDNTNLDRTMNFNVGSMAVRQFIEEFQPYLTLHGHIHETVDVSGDFRQRIGSSLSLCPGNHNIGEELAVILFDLYEPGSAERKII